MVESDVSGGVPTAVGGERWWLLLTKEKRWEKGEKHTKNCVCEVV